MTVVSSQGFSAQEGTAKFASAGAAAKGAAALATGHDGHGYARCCVMLLAGRCKTEWGINERGSIEPRRGTFR